MVLDLMVNVGHATDWNRFSLRLLIVFSTLCPSNIQHNIVCLHCFWQYVWRRSSKKTFAWSLFLHFLNFLVNNILTQSSNYLLGKLQIFFFFFNFFVQTFVKCRNIDCMCVLLWRRRSRCFINVCMCVGSKRNPKRSSGPSSKAHRVELGVSTGKRLTTAASLFTCYQLIVI